MGGGGGGKGGESKQSIDPRLTQAAVDALDFAKAGAAIPYSPNRGVQFAAFTPQQEAAMANASTAAGAFGLATGGPAQMPQVETSASGIRGYSTGKDFDQMRDKSMSKGLQDAIGQLFADPKTGYFKGPGGPLMGQAPGGGTPGSGKDGGAGGNPGTTPAERMLYAGEEEKRRQRIAKKANNPGMAFQAKAAESMGAGK